MSAIPPLYSPGLRKSSPVFTLSDLLFHIGNCWLKFKYPVLDFRLHIGSIEEIDKSYEFEATTNALDLHWLPDGTSVLVSSGKYFPYSPDDDIPLTLFDLYASPDLPIKDYSRLYAEILPYVNWDWDSMEWNAGCVPVKDLSPDGKTVLLLPVYGRQIIVAELDTLSAFTILPGITFDCMNEIRWVP